MGRAGVRSLEDARSRGRAIRGTRGSSLQEVGGESVGEGVVAGWAQVEVVAYVVRGEQAAGVGRVAYGLVEVQDGVEGAAGADPGVDLLAGGFAVACRVVVVVAAEGGEGGSVHQDVVGVGADGDLFVGGDQVGGDILLVFGGGGAQVVHAFEDDQPADAAQREDVAVEAGEGVLAEPVVEDAVAAGGLVGDGEAAEPVEELVGPAVVVVGGRSPAVGETVADQGEDRHRRLHLDAAQEVPVLDRRRARQLGAAGLVACGQVGGGPGAGVGGDARRVQPFGEVHGDGQHGAVGQ